MKTLPFLPEFVPLIQSGAKTCTARTKAYGVGGEVVDSPAGRLRLVAVSKVPLAHVRDHCWEQEGVESPEAFEAVWRRLHRRKGFDAEQSVWLHVFALDALEENA